MNFRFSNQNPKILLIYMLKSSYNTQLTMGRNHLSSDTLWKWSFKKPPNCQSQEGVWWNDPKSRIKTCNLSRRPLSWLESPTQARSPMMPLPNSPSSHSRTHSRIHKGESLPAHSFLSLIRIHEGTSAFAKRSLVPNRVHRDFFTLVKRNHYPHPTFFFAIMG